MVWDSYLLKNFPQTAVTYTVFSVVYEAEVDVFKITTPPPAEYTHISTHVYVHTARQPDRFSRD